MDKRLEGLYYIFELATKDDIEILLNMDRTEWRGSQIRIQTLRKFFYEYNDSLGKNIIPKEKKSNFNSLADSDNKLHMSGIPVTAKEHEIRAIVESFGQLYSFKLVKDPTNDELNRGFCFFEYVDKKVTERALKV
jgi:hypothetical protein